jgi:hypothetical protein
MQEQEMEQQQQQLQAQQQARETDLQQKLDSFQKGFSACVEAKNYVVK